MDDGWVEQSERGWMNIAITIYVDECLLNACLETGLALTAYEDSLRRPFREPLNVRRPHFFL
jgi:hypothetical protein